MNTPRRPSLAIFRFEPAAHRMTPRAGAIVRAYLCMKAGPGLLSNGSPVAFTAYDLEQIAADYDPDQPAQLRVSRTGHLSPSVGTVLGLVRVRNELFAVAEISEEGRALSGQLFRIGVSLSHSGSGSARRFRLDHIVFIQAESDAPTVATGQPSFAAFSAPSPRVHTTASGTLAAALDLQTLAGMPFIQAVHHAQRALSRSNRQ